MAGFGVMIGIDVLVEAGNIRVMAGKGSNVVVGVTEGVTVGVDVCVGVGEVVDVD